MSKVKEYQQYLNSLGAALKVDGAWGNKTQTAYEKLVKGNDTQKKDDKEPKPRSQPFPVTLVELGSYKAPDRRMLNQNRASPSPSSKEPRGASILGDLGTSFPFGNATSQFFGEWVNQHTKFLPGKKELVNLQMTEDGLRPINKKFLYKVIDEKVKRTGELKGTIGYDDLTATLSEEEGGNLKKAVRGEVHPLTKAYYANKNPAVDVALSLGNFEYKKDPNTGKIHVTDEYDFLNSSNVKKDKEGKRSLVEDWVNKDVRNGNSNTKRFFNRHDSFTKYDLWAKENKDWNNRKVDINLSPTDTLSNSAIRSRFKESLLST